VPLAFFELAGIVNCFPLTGIAFFGSASIHTMWATGIANFLEGGCILSNSNCSCFSLISRQFIALTIGSKSVATSTSRSNP
jgi:hypothetical protein